MHAGYSLRRLFQFLIILRAAATINAILPRLAPASEGGPVRIEMSR